MIIYEPSLPFIVLNRRQWEAADELDIFRVSKEELDEAEKTDEGFIKQEFGINYFLTKNIPTAEHRI